MRYSGLTEKNLRTSGKEKAFYPLNVISEAPSCHPDIPEPTLSFLSGLGPDNKMACGNKSLNDLKNTCFKCRRFLYSLSLSQVLQTLNLFSI